MNAEPSSSRPVRRIGKSFSITLQFILFVIVVISANYLSCAKHKRIDLTERKDFTLSGTSISYLKSDVFQKRDTPIHVIAVIRRGSNHYSRIYNLLDEYNTVSGKSLELEIVDPLRQTDRTLEIENTYHIPYSEDMIIIDGRSKAEKEAFATANSDANSAELQTKKKHTFSSHIRTTFIKDLYITDESKSILAWQDEDIITSTIIGAIEGNTRKFYFAVDKVNLKTQQGQPAWQTLREILWQQNVDLTPIRLAETEKIPEDATGFAIIGPQYDLDKREIALLQEYWDRKQSSVLITLDPKVRLENLRIFLRNYGVTPRHDRIISAKNGQTLSSVQGIFSPGSKINQELGGKSTIFDGSSSTLEIRENDDSLLNRAILPIALVQASQGWWGETRYEEENPQPSADEDTLKPVYLAAAVLRGDATSDETTHLVSKMVVIANTDFLSTTKTRPEQIDFIKSSVNWIIGRENLIGIGPKKLFRNKLTILPAHNSFISRVVLFFLPAISILMALIVWNTRRA